MSVVARLDHVICEVSDIRLTHAEWQDRGFPEAWPIGPFWPNALTSGICVGNFNLELYQPLDRVPCTPAIRTAVFEPTSVENAVATLSSLGIEHEVRMKTESDPDLLRLRGFSGDNPELICTNIVPLDNDYPFFLCLYAPYLKTRLSPASFSVNAPILSTEVRWPRHLDRQLIETIGLNATGIQWHC